LDSLQHPGVCQSQPSPLSHVAGPANSLCPSWMLNSRDKRTIAPVSLIRHARAKTLTYAHPLTVGTLSKLTCSCTRTRTCTPNARARARAHRKRKLKPQNATSRTWILHPTACYLSPPRRRNNLLATPSLHSEVRLG